MNTYRIIVRESIEYSIEADTEEEARDLLYMGDQQVVNNRIVDWDIMKIKE
jgi:hypothetical protein